MDFGIDEEFQSKLEWIREFVTTECEPLDHLFPSHFAPWDVKNPKHQRILRTLQREVKERGLWNCHLTPELGGKGYGQMKLAYMNEIIGRSYWAPVVFGASAPDTGNSEILAMFGTEEQKKRFLQPLMDNEIVSCFSMTEPQAGADPKEFNCRAYEDGDHWVIDGYKWFTTNARLAEFFIVMAVTNPEASPHQRMSMLIVPKDTPGIKIIRNVGVLDERFEDEDEGMHAYIHYDEVRVPKDHMLGGPGEGFKVAQARLGGGRIHHAMRNVGICNRALEMMQERAVSRRAQGKLLSEHQFVQGMIADSAIQIEQFRLLVLKTAWVIDNEPHGAARTLIAMCKVEMARVKHDIIQRAIQLHGSYGVSNETPLAKWWAAVPSAALADGPTEVHKVQVAKAFLGLAKPSKDVFPSSHIPYRLEEARNRWAKELAG